MRNTLEKVSAIYEKHGCVLKAKEFKGEYNDMEFICSCGKIGNKTFNAFRKTPRCKYCKNKFVSNVMLRKDYTYEEIDEYFEENDVPEDIYYHMILNGLNKKTYNKLNEIYSIINLNDKVFKINFSKI